MQNKRPLNKTQGAHQNISFNLLRHCIQPVERQALAYETKKRGIQPPMSSNLAATHEWETKANKGSHVIVISFSKVGPSIVQ